MSHDKNTQRSATTGGGEGDPAGSEGAIGSYTDTELSGYVTLHTDTSTLPISAETRGNAGTFQDIDDVLKYLDGGYLKHEDNGGGPVINPIVHVVKFFNDWSNSYEYEVYIDDQTS